MSTCEQIITRAFRKLRELGMAETVLAEQADRGLEELQGLYDDLTPTLTALTDVYKTATTYTAGENERVIAPVQTSITITLPTSLEDPLTGDTRAPIDGSVVVEVFQDTGARKVYIWDAATAAWVRTDTLALTDAAPLSGRYTNALSSMLALRVAEVAGLDAPAAVAKSAALGRLALATRADSVRAPAQVDFF